MTSQTTFDILILATGVIGILTALTLVGEILRARLPWGETDPGVETFMTRVQSWWGMVILLSLAVLSGKIGLLLLFAFASFAALREFLTYATKRRADHLSLALGAFVILPLQYVFVGLGWTGLHTVFIPVYAFLLLPIVSALRGDPDRFLVRVAETQWGLMICVFCISHVPALLTYGMPDGSDRSVLLIVFLVIVVQSGDLVDYYVGRSLGRRRIAPALSPRTLEGVAAGVIGAGIIGAGLGWITPFGMAGAAAMAALAAAAGIFGSLVFAAIKRDKGVKDWSHLIPGQGGFLDQLHGVIFAAPVFYHVTHLIWG
ncbi:phosphatidate cytidylyltransferase [Roseicyclus mahoneyensis]|uniref:Phosphatidate cytidylyltransferase n=1 Tax=Roseicyclus mahoneyensis TaxID=164332 RepID=A0A316GDR9_9RHOB|nr:phosphatidate cytidylyltransferase [Roseicyclus mahoneyensis]PWK58076.1 phosphatidate cytidylyltransferase [Roseicyclus mahoneyensis]